MKAMVKTVLVVDDDPGVLYTVKHGLEGSSTDYRVVCAESGAKCFELLVEKKEYPDLILLDIMMPGMNGWEVYSKLREKLEWRIIPLVFLTATSDETSKRIGRIMGRDYIEKPFEIPDLKQRIEKILKDIE